MRTNKLLLPTQFHYFAPQIGVEATIIVVVIIPQIIIINNNTTDIPNKLRTW